MSYSLNSVVREWLLEEIGRVSVQLAEANEYWNAAFEINRYGTNDQIRSNYERCKAMQDRLWKRSMDLERRYKRLVDRYRDLTDPARLL